ncbi:MAG: PAS domain S-box protein [Chloroflexi bacterium]|nr:PAS domain S-box protein [Chloroflexota bacterium]
MESTLNHTRDDLALLPRPLAALDPAFVDSIQASVIVIDRKHRILLANKFARQWLKHSAEEMRGQFCYHLVHRAEEVCADCPSAITFRTGESASTIHTGLDGEGGTTYAQITTHAIKDKRGKVTHVIEYGVDVSERVLAEQQLVTQNKRLATLNAIAEIASGSLDVDEMLQSLLAKLIEVTQGDAGAIMLLNDAGDELALRCHQGLSPELVVRPGVACVKPGKQRIWTAAIGRGPLRTNNFDGEVQSLAEALKGEGIHALASVPLKSRNRAQGIVNIVRRENREFTPGDLELLVASADHIGTAVENASLFRYLAESEEKYRTTVENSNDIIWALDPAGTFIWGNRRGEEITGHKMEEWIGKSFAPLIVPEDLPLVQQVFADTLAGRPRNYEVRVYNKDRDIVVLLVNTSPIISNGEVVGTVSFGKDITDRKQAEEERARLAREQAARVEAEAARRRISDVLESITDAFFALDRDWRFTYVNRQTESVLTIKREEVIGKNIWDVFPGALGSLFYVECFRAASQQLTAAFESFYSDREIWFDVRAYPSENGLAVYFRDITARKQTEEALQHSQERFRNLVETTSDWVWEVGEDVRYTYVSPKVRDLLGYDPEEILGKTPFDLMPPEEAKRVAGLFVPIAAQRRPFSGLENTNLHKDGRPVVLESGGVPVFGASGEFRGYRGIDRDITARKRTDEFREQYVHTVSHDLRNPLATIRGRAQMLERSFREAQGSVSRERYLDNVSAILTATKRMNAMIQDLVDSARLEAGQLHLDAQPVDLELFVPELLGRITDVLDTGRVHLEIASGCRPALADPDRLERILLNLLTNALKYSDQETTVRVEVRQSDGKAIISVADLGIGIAAADLPHIFERFYRAGDAAKAGGLGLGLYITRMLVEAHGGRIWVESEPAGGSTFYFFLPQI